MALEEGVEMELVSERIGELRAQKEALEATLADLGEEHHEDEEELLLEQPERLPDLSESLRTASPRIKRQVFQAFDLQIAFDRTNGTVEISATVSEAVAEAFKHKDLLARGGPGVVPRDIAGTDWTVGRFRCNVVLVNSSIGYRLGKRAVTTDQTRQRILGAAENLYLARWYDDVSLQAVANEAGVALQTVINHFGSKGALIAAVATRMSSRINRRRDEVEPGDVTGAVKMIVSEYEDLGDVIFRFISLEGRIQELGPLLAGGRGVHRSWVERVFFEWLPENGPDRKRATAMLIAATDVLTWKVLRREQALSRRDTELAMRTSVLALVERTGK